MDTTIVCTPENHGHLYTIDSRKLESGGGFALFGIIKIT